MTTKAFTIIAALVMTLTTFSGTVATLNYAASEQGQQA